MSYRFPFPSALRALALAAFAALALSACATNRASTSLESPDYSGLSQSQTEEAVVQLGARYKANPRDTGAAIHFAAALRAAGQTSQAVAVMEQAMAVDGNNASVRIAYAKALAANGTFEQALNVIEATIDPSNPDWNALSVKGAIPRPDGSERAGARPLPPGTGDGAARSFARGQSRLELCHDQ